MAELKTKATGESVAAFLDGIADEQVRTDSRVVSRMMQKATKARPKMWGNMVGFGSRTITYADGRELEWMEIAFAPRKKRITLYLKLKGQDALMKKLGPHACGKGCLHIKSLSSVHVPTLQKLITETISDGRRAKRSAR